MRKNPLLATRLSIAALAFLVSTVAMARPSNKWRIQVSESAKSDSAVVLQFAPIGEEAFEVEVTVEKGSGENAVARRISKVLRSALPAERYHVEVDDGEDVLVKKRGQAPRFDLKIVSNSVRSVRVNLDRE